MNSFKKIFSLLLVCFNTVGFSQNPTGNEIGFHIGRGIDYGTKSNEHLKKYNRSIGAFFEFGITEKQKVGFLYCGDSKNTEDEKIVDFISDEKNEHKDIIQLTRGNHNSFQLGVTYSYTEKIKNFLVKGKVGFGALYLSKSPHLIEFTPYDTTNYSYKRFITTKSHEGSKGWGMFGSLAIEFGYQINQVNLFIGSRYVYGKAKMDNVYVEEYNHNGIDIFTFYTEKNIISAIDIHVGVSFFLNKDSNKNDLKPNF